MIVLRCPAQVLRNRQTFWRTRQHCGVVWYDRQTVSTFLAGDIRCPA